MLPAGLMSGGGACDIQASTLSGERKINKITIYGCVGSLSFMFAMIGFCSVVTFLVLTCVVWSRFLSWSIRFVSCGCVCHGYLYVGYVLW